VVGWRSQFAAEGLAEFETFLGSTLKDLGYALASGKDPRNGRQFSGRRAAYQTVYGTKLWLKRNTPLGRWLISDDLSWL
jgi:hypothetical protein